MNSISVETMWQEMMFLYTVCNKRVLWLKYIPSRNTTNTDTKNAKFTTRIPKHVPSAQNLNKSSNEIPKGIVPSYFEIQEEFNQCAASEFGVQDFNKTNNKRVWGTVQFW